MVIWRCPAASTSVWLRTKQSKDGDARIRAAAHLRGILPGNVKEIVVGDKKWLYRQQTAVAEVFEDTPLETSPRDYHNRKSPKITPVRRLGSGPRVVGWIGSAVRVSPSFQFYKFCFKNVAALRGEGVNSGNFLYG